jgi:hypothetical protein
VSAFSDVRRAEVVARAGHRCEYCHLPVRGQVATFPIDHIVPKSAGGSNELDNLALTCPHCNAHKWMEIEYPDPQTGELVRYFHPRRDSWSDHFEWSADRRGELVGKTAYGRATIAGLRINNPDMVELRVLLSGIGLFPELVG